MAAVLGKEAFKPGASEPAEPSVRFSPAFMKIPLPAVTTMELGDLMLVPALSLARRVLLKSLPCIRMYFISELKEFGQEQNF